LIMEKNGTPVRAYEIKSSARIVDADLSGLGSFRKEYPKVPLGVVSQAENPYPDRRRSGSPLENLTGLIAGNPERIVK
jgi:hypothetical protein